VTTYVAAVASESNNCVTGQAWGDNALRSWMASPVADPCGSGSSGGSEVSCIESSSKARFCTFKNAMVNCSSLWYSLLNRV
jgi:hypothetical protein